MSNPKEGSEPGLEHSPPVPERASGQGWELSELTVEDIIQYDTMPAALAAGAGKTKEKMKKPTARQPQEKKNKEMATTARKLQEVKKNKNKTQATARASSYGRSPNYGTAEGRAWKEREKKRETTAYAPSSVRSPKYETSQGWALKCEAVFDSSEGRAASYETWQTPSMGQEGLAPTGVEGEKKRSEAAAEGGMGAQYTYESIAAEGMEGEEEPSEAAAEGGMGLQYTYGSTAAEGVEGEEEPSEAAAEGGMGLQYTYESTAAEEVEGSSVDLKPYLLRSLAQSYKIINDTNYYLDVYISGVDIITKFKQWAAGAGSNAANVALALDHFKAAERPSWRVVKARRNGKPGVYTGIDDGGYVTVLCQADCSQGYAVNQWIAKGWKLLLSGPPEPVHIMPSAYGSG